MTTDFASAVAAVRAMENTLLSSSDIDRMARSGSYSEIAAVLNSRGKNVPENRTDFYNSLDDELERVWSFIRDMTGDCRELEILLYRNDFHNLKAALKALIMNTDPTRLFIRPTLLKLDELPEIIASKRYEELPEYMRNAATDAYGILTQTLDGQLADAVIDTAAIKAMQADSEKYGGELLHKYSKTIALCSDIKTAYRCSIMKKSESFMQLALCGSDELDKNALIRSAVGGTESLLSFLESSGYREAADMLRESPAAFEKWCDDELMKLAEEARFKAFGPDPLAAYFIAQETEIKNLRILLVCKDCGASGETISERMRKLYA